MRVMSCLKMQWLETLKNTMQNLLAANSDRDVVNLFYGFSNIFPIFSNRYDW
jgi:hypothetical protein